MPLLIEHFMEHQEENSNMTLWKFLYVHYASGDVKDADYDKDMKLPFKSHENCVMAISNIFLPLSGQISISQPAAFLQKKNFVRKDRFINSSFLSNIWQPPRIS